MKIWKYDSYEEYVKSQVDGIYNHPTVKDNYNYEWYESCDIIFLRDNVINPHFLKCGKTPKFGICHGAKLGKENIEFEKQTGVSFIGTDISIETNPKMKLIEWDFHEIKDEWINAVDIIYSNALDHSYDPKLCLKRWIKCLSDVGIGIIEHSNNDLKSTSTDPFGATIEEYCELIGYCGGKIINIHKFSGKRIYKNFLVFSKKHPEESV
jgi:hypothetical protein